MHVHEYVDIIALFIEHRLAALHQQSLTISAEEVFDIANPGQAKLCFYIIRHLIRLNNRQFDDELRFLLTIPAVKALAHCPVTPNQPNELVRRALSTNNQEAAAILLNLPEGRAVAAQKDYYRQDAQGSVD